MKFPKFATNLTISLRICQSNRELKSEGMNFTWKFEVRKLLACVAWRFCREHHFRRANLGGFSALARLYYFARRTKTAMLRGLASYEFLKLTSTSNLLLKLNCIFYNSRFIELDGNLQGQNGWQKLPAYFGLFLTHSLRTNLRVGLLLKLLTSDQVDTMFSKELTLPLGGKSLLIFNFYSTQCSETPIKRTPSWPSQLSA